MSGSHRPPRRGGRPPGRGNRGFHHHSAENSRQHVTHSDRNFISDIGVQNPRGRYSGQSTEDRYEYSDTRNRNNSNVQHTRGNYSHETSRVETYQGHNSFVTAKQSSHIQGVGNFAHRGTRGSYSNQHEDPRHSNPIQFPKKHNVAVPVNTLFSFSSSSSSVASRPRQHHPTTVQATSFNVPKNYPVGIGFKCPNSFPSEKVRFRDPVQNSTGSGTSNFKGENVQRKDVQQKRCKKYRKNVPPWSMNVQHQAATRRNVFRRKTNQKAEPEQNLFSFTRTGKTTSSLPSDDDDDDETSTTLSRCSSPESTVSTKNMDADSGSEDLSDDSCLSEQSNVLSQAESFDANDSISGVYAASSCSFAVPSGEERFVSVYWDIENCPVPKEKSAVDIVKKIRETFYDGRTEDSFIVACDMRNLSAHVDKELTESHVSLIHASSQSKNAADTKLQRFLLQFQFQYRMKDAAIVLVSGDSDFSTYLYDMRYKHHIYVNLICNKNARKALKEASHNCILFDDFVRGLPNRSDNENLQYYLIVSDLPAHVKKSAIKSFLSEKIVGINGRVKNVSPTNAEILFSNESTSTKALSLLEGIDVYGSKVSLKLEARSLVQKPTQKEVAKVTNITNVLGSSPVLGHTSLSEVTKDVRKEKCDSKKKTADISKEMVAPNASSKSATLYVFVNKKQGDVKFWTREFVQLFSNKEICVESAGSSFDGCFLIKFPSLSQAQKARKILETKQKQDSKAPRFLKLVKEDNDLCLSSNFEPDVKQISRRKIEEKVNFVQKKKGNCLNNFQEAWNLLKSSTAMSSEERAAIASKRDELNEQKITYLNYVEQACKKLQGLDESLSNIDLTIDDILKDFCRECVCFETGLPVYAKKNIIIKKIRAHQVVVIQAETGSGKSTQICQYLWREGFGNTGLIVCTQPRKIAAISLAKHVSSQVGCSLGSIVGYRVGISNKGSEKTQLLYVTDFTMLKMCSEDPLFKQVSCIIIDEAHERSIYTDLLLGMVKRSLYLRPDIRVIITSATLKINLFQMYFHLPNDAIINVSGRTFPIEDVWLGSDVHSGWNYFDKTINVASELLDQEAGDVLAFLPTPLETEKAVEKFSSLVKNKNYKLRVHQLHGKLDVQEQQKIFERTPPGMRKIVFSTNCAETSITIPGIRYVIDSGMVKESRYDAVRNINVLAVGFVNKSSAEQRRGRAGRTQSGKCYRLYSKRNYNDMTDNMVPEILRVNLGQALLKLMLLGIQNPLEFDYVESPPMDSMTAAMKQLIHLGAVNENYELTTLGSQIAALPLEPRLCHLILKGIEECVGYEAVVVAALATVSRNIFFRNTDNKDEADLKKVRFCQSESDYLTFLEIFKEWCDVPKSGKSRWCVTNCINGRSMKLAHELVNELILTFSKDLNMKIPTKFTSDTSHTKTIHNLIFHSFAENLCIFSGHNRIGYLSLGVPGNLVIHPSSSLFSLGKWRPRYIVYDSILKTTQSFLVNITAVDHDVLENSVQNGLLSINMHNLNNLPVSPYIFSHLGHYVLKNILGPKGQKLKSLENELREMCDGRGCAAEVDFNKGQLKLFVPHMCERNGEYMFRPFIDGFRTNTLNEEKIAGDFVDIPSLSAVIGAGGRIHDVILPGEYRDVVIRPADTYVSDVVKILERFGEVVHVKEGKNCKYVTFETVSSAKTAVEQIAQMQTSFTVTPGASFAPCEPIAFFKVLITVVRRRCTGLAFFSVSPPPSIPEVFHKLSRNAIQYRSNYLNVNVSKKCPDDLCIRNVPPDVNDEELRALIERILPNNVKLSKFLTVRDKEFASNPEEVTLMKNQITVAFEQFTAFHKLHVDVHPPKPRDKSWKACVYFNNPHDGQHAVNVLNSYRSLGSHKILNNVIGMKPILETSLFCFKEVFDAIKSEVKDALEFFNKGHHENKKLEINAKPTDSEKRVIICISGNNIADIIDAKKTLQRFIQGNPIECSGKPLLEKLFLEKGKNFLKKLSNEIPNFYLNLNHHTKVITMFGNNSACTAFNLSLNQYLDHLEREMGMTADVPLKSSSSSKSLLKEIIGRYGLNLEKLCEACNLSSAKVNVYKHVLTISGNDGSITQCKNVIAQISAEIGEQEELSSDAEECPVCCCEVSSPFHRMEYCGHAYCEVCILSQLNSIEETPILCCYEGCNKPFVIQDLLWATGKVKTLKRKIHTTALETHMKSSDFVKYCPSANCSMIYRVSTVNQDYGITCTSCLNDICTKCCVLYHVGMSCDLYQNMKGDDDYSLKLWLKADPNNNKLCPSCKSPIEKNGGCLHMTCWKCHCHMCWRCMRTFPTGNEVYLHQPHCPML